MSDRDYGESEQEGRDAVAEAFDRTLDPLVEHTETFERIDVDPFELFHDEVLQSGQYAESTRAGYQRIYRQWRNHMAEAGRHPACPNEQHVQAFAEHYLAEQDNQPDTVRTKLRRLSNVLEYWQKDTAFPHQRDYNPFEFVLEKLDLSRPDVKQPPRISIPELRGVIDEVTHIRDRLVIGTQLKLGLRASELCNLQLQDINLDVSELRTAYPELGTHPSVTHRPNSVYIATRKERDGNKSRNPRVLPIDEELRDLFRRYLLVRPDTGAEWAFLSETSHTRMGRESVNRIWTAAFHPKYEETTDHRAVTSHFGRHRFTTYWGIAMDLNRELVQYMRGDTPQDANNGDREAIDDYLHTYYEDIESVYRNNVFQLDL